MPKNDNEAIAKNLNDAAIAAAVTTSPVPKAAKTNSPFDVALTNFSTSTAQSMKYAQICADMSILHFEAHGDVSYCQRFLDAMPKKYVRRAGYLLWLKAYSPITMSQGKLAKDKGAKAVEFNTDAAVLSPFWDHSPPEEQINWGADDVVVALKAAVKKFHKETYTPKDDLALARLAKAEALIQNIA